MATKQYYIRLSETDHTSHFETISGYPVPNKWGLDLFTHKPSDPAHSLEWVVSDNRTGLRISTDTTRKGAIKSALERLSDKGARDYMLSLRDVSPAYGGARNVVSKKEKYADEFYNIFGVHLKFYWDYFPGLDLGFDVIKFDKFIDPPDGTSCAQAVNTKYGARAEQLIHELLAS